MIQNLPSLILSVIFSVIQKISANPIKSALTAIGLAASAFLWKRNQDENTLRERVKILSSLGKEEYEAPLAEAGIPPKDTAKIIELAELFFTPETAREHRVLFMEEFAKVPKDERDEMIQLLQELNKIPDVSTPSSTHRLFLLMRLPRKTRPEAIKVARILMNSNSENLDTSDSWDRALRMDLYLSSLENTPREEWLELATFAKSLADSDLKNSSNKTATSIFNTLCSMSGEGREYILELTKTLVDPKVNIHEFSKLLSQVSFLDSQYRDEIIEAARALINPNSKGSSQLISEITKLKPNERKQIVSLARSLITKNMENNERARIVYELAQCRPKYRELPMMFQ